MFFGLVLVAVLGIAVGEVANVPMGSERQTLGQTVDCATDADEWVAHCAFPDRKLHSSGSKGAK